MSERNIDVTRLVKHVTVASSVLSIFPILFTSLTLTQDQLLASIPLIFLIAVLHEAMHVLALRVLGLRFRISLSPTLVAVKILNVLTYRDYVITALSPQTITATLLVIYVLHHSNLMLLLSIVHIFMSSLDVAMCIYLYRYRMYRFKICEDDCGRILITIV